MASLAAAGYNNREIAERLYLTQRNVETHLTHAFQRLSIATRNELATHIGVDERREERTSRVPAVMP